MVERTRELAESNAGLRQLAIDALTGLPNRLHWTGEARKAMDGARRHGDRLAVAFVDLDHFQNVNDSLGHSAGDLLLKSVSRRLQACLRSQDVMVRQGGAMSLWCCSRPPAQPRRCHRGGHQNGGGSGSGLDCCWGTR